MAAGVAASVILLAGIAAAQTVSEPLTPPSGPPAVAPAPAPPPATEGPGLAGVFGTWLQQGMTSMGNGFDAMMDAAKGVAKGAADAAKGAADVAVDGVTKLTVAGVASGREQCAIAGNGAPDCQVAAEALCRARGFGTGASVDFVTAEKCQPPYRASGRDTPEGACTLGAFRDPRPVQVESAGRACKARRREAAAHLVVTAVGRRCGPGPRDGQSRT
jgi:hypothetical protein